jgi:hypothetical protein
MKDEDRKQLVVNLYDLVTKLGVAAQNSLEFAATAIPKDAGALKMDGPGSKVAEMGVEALKAGTKAVELFHIVSVAAIYLAEETEGEDSSDA